MQGVHNHVGVSGETAEPAMARLGAIQNLNGPPPEQPTAAVSQAGAALRRKGPKTASKQQVSPGVEGGNATRDVI
jgi:hypothetical protein